MLSGLDALFNMAFIWQLVSYGIYLVGVVAIALFLYDNFISVIGIVKAYLEPYFQPQLPQSLVDKYGKWAVVTGCTDGIGREYTRELAQRGLNIVLISRTKEKLIAVATELEREFKVKTKWIVADFAKGRPIYEHIEKELAGIPVGILVNNVGKMYDYPDDLEKVPADVLWDIMNLNIAAATMMCHMLIPQMKKQGKGAIVNMSSGSELQPIPYMAVYSASKRYVKSFSQAIERELAAYNITVQCVTPLFVVTKMNDYAFRLMRAEGFVIPNVKTFTRWAVATLGKTTLTTGYWSHGVQYFFMKLVPESLRVRAGQHCMNQLRSEYFAVNGQVKE